MLDYGLFPAPMRDLDSVTAHGHQLTWPIRKEPCSISCDLDLVRNRISTLSFYILRLLRLHLLEYVLQFLVQWIPRTSMEIHTDRRK